MFMVLILAKKVIKYNLLGLLLLIIIGVIVYLSMLILLKDDMIIEQINNLKNKFNNLKK